MTSKTRIHKTTGLLTWYAVTDIVIAYIPMAWIGGKIAGKLSKGK